MIDPELTEAEQRDSDEINAALRSACRRRRAREAAAFETVLGEETQVPNPTYTMPGEDL